MKCYVKATGLLFALVMPTDLSFNHCSRRTPMTARRLARPDQIWVYDFVATSTICRLIRRWPDESATQVRRPRLRRWKRAQIWRNDRPGVGQRYQAMGLSARSYGHH
jgi:hypothetical protein